MARSIWMTHRRAIGVAMLLALCAPAPTHAQSTAPSASPATGAKPASAKPLSAKEAAVEAKRLAAQHEELLQKGLPPKEAIESIEALSAIGATSSSDAIAPYVEHRSADVRKAAAQALARTKGPKAAAALRKGLRSSDGVVRVLAAVGLGAVGDKESAPDLLRALDRGIVEAAPSIAAVCAGVHCDALVTRHGKLPSDVRKASLEAMLRRKPALPDDVLVSAVNEVSVAEGSTAKAFFQGLKTSFKGSKKVKAALEAAARAPNEGKP